MDTNDPSLSHAIPQALADSPGFLLNRAARIIRDLNTEALKPTGLSVRDLGLLRIIASEVSLTQQALSDKHGTDRTTIVEAIDGLEKRKLVQRSQNISDRRSYLLTITPRGSKLLAAANKLLGKTKSEFLGELTIEEWVALRTLLSRLITHHNKK